MSDLGTADAGSYVCAITQQPCNPRRALEFGFQAPELLRRVVRIFQRQQHQRHYPLAQRVPVDRQNTDNVQSVAAGHASRAMHEVHVFGVCQANKPFICPSMKMATKNRSQLCQTPSIDYEGLRHRIFTGTARRRPQPSAGTRGRQQGAPAACCHGMPPGAARVRCQWPPAGFRCLFGSAAEWTRAESLAANASHACSDAPCCAGMCHRFLVTSGRRPAPETAVGGPAGQLYAPSESGQCCRCI